MLGARISCNFPSLLSLLSRMGAANRHLHLCRKVLVHGLQLWQLFATPNLILIESVDTISVGREAGEANGFGCKTMGNTPTSAFHYRNLGDAEPITLSYN